MFEASSLLYLYVETPLHAGSGRGLGAVDLPVQRERVTGYPMVQGSGIKGKLRAEAAAWAGDNVARQEQVKAIFGPEPGPGASDHAGALSVGDARLLLFPVRSLAGVFAWTTSHDALARFVRDAAAARLSLMREGNGRQVPVALPAAAPTDNTALVSAADVPIIAGGKVVLEEFSFAPQTDAAVAHIANWLVRYALPGAFDASGNRTQDDVYRHWAEKLPTSLVILPEDAFRDFTQLATEVVTRVALDVNKKTVRRGALWTEESLPTDTLLYAPLHATSARRRDSQRQIPAGVPQNWYGPGGAAELLRFVAGLPLTWVQLGGDETVGRGLVRLRFGEVHNA